MYCHLSNICPMRKFSVLKLRNDLCREDVKASLILISKSNPSSILIQNNRELLDDVIYTLSKSNFNSKEVLYEWLKVKDISPPLELLWRLEEKKFLKIVTYLNFNREYCSTLNDFLSNTLQDNLEDAERVQAKTILSKIISTILNLRNNNNFKFFQEEIVSVFVSEALDNFNCSSLEWNYLVDLKTHIGLNESMKGFALLHLEKFLKYDVDRYDVTFVILSQTKLWSSEKLSEQSKSFMNEFIGVLDPQKVLDELDNVVTHGSFDWKNILLLISMYVKELKSAELMKGKIDKWLISALEEKDKFLLFVSLIMARHCCYEKARYFVNYPTWFGSLSLKTVAAFTFFFECLSQIVPDEPPLCLKIHVNKIPSAPTSCQRIILDYLALAKTRLSDLGETTDYIGLFNDYYETDEQGQESDIQRAIKLFQETKEIPKALLEASVFRRKYYEQTFLKRLLSVSQNEDEQRAELIKKLYSSGKIPSTLYRAWSSRSLTHTPC